MRSITKDLIGAAATPIVLSILSENDSYGYEIAQKVKNLSKGEIKWNEPSIYPVLKKLEKSGMIKSYWKTSSNQRPRKYYTLLSKGKVQLSQSIHEWELVKSVFTTLFPKTKQKE